MIYIKEQFDLQHYKHDCISSEYKLQDKIEKQKEFLGQSFEDKENSYNELNISDESGSVISSSIDDNRFVEIETEADMFMTSNQKQAAYYEQEQY